MDETFPFLHKDGKKYEHNIYMKRKAAYSSDSCDTLNKDLHFLSGNRSVSVFIELSEASLEVCIGELLVFSHFQ